MERRAASVEATSRRAIVTLGNFQVNFAIFQVRVSRMPVPISKKEFDLLGELAVRHDTIVSFAELSWLLWRESGPKCSRRLITLVHRLRVKLGGMEPYQLTSVRGVGYGLVSPYWYQSDSVAEE
jgi:DNA-binding response OmpR family regulator